jgi:hypothetical protein
MPDNILIGDRKKSSRRAAIRVELRPVFQRGRRVSGLAVLSYPAHCKDVFAAETAPGIARPLRQQRRSWKAVHGRSHVDPREQALVPDSFRAVHADSRSLVVSERIPVRVQKCATATALSWMENLQNTQSRDRLHEQPTPLNRFQTGSPPYFPIEKGTAPADTQKAHADVHE